MNMFRKILTRIPADQRRITISTAITVARIMLVPIIVAAMVMHYWNLAFWLFVVAAISDVLDGWLARLLHDHTLLGASLDPLADKFLIISCFATLAFVQSPLFSIPLWFVLFILIKELLLIAGVVAMVVLYGFTNITPTWLGKATMVAQTCFILWLFVCYGCQWVPTNTYHVMLGGLALLVFASLVHYTYVGIKWLNS